MEKNKDILTKLASARGDRSEKPNVLLAKDIAGSNNEEAVALLVDNLDNKSRAIQNDCIKVLYELGELKPAMLVRYAQRFIELLSSKNNRMQWGAMTTINMITAEVPDLVYKAIGQIIDVADKGSVITKDHAVNILVKLCAADKYAEDAFELLNEQILHAFPNQLPSYAEKAYSVVRPKHKAILLNTLLLRLSDVKTDTKRKRVEKVIAKLRK